MLFKLKGNRNERLLNIKGSDFNWGFISHYYKNKI